MEIIEGRLSDAIHYYSPHFNQRPAGDVSLLVIHNISLPPNQFLADTTTDYITDLFMGTLNCDVHEYFDTLRGLEVSAHCLITRAGAVKQYVSFDDRAWHAGKSSYQGVANCNDYAIGIELEGADSVAYTDPQYQALVSVTIALMKRYPKITLPSIVGHCDIAPLRKSDPGIAFDWPMFRQKIIKDIL